MTRTPAHQISAIQGKCETCGKDSDQVLEIPAHGDVARRVLFLCNRHFREMFAGIASKLSAWKAVAP